MHLWPQVTISSPNKLSITKTQFREMILPFGSVCYIFLYLKLFKTYYLNYIDSHAELGSRRPVESPVEPSGPTEYTEQTVDAESQVTFLNIFVHTFP